MTDNIELLSLFTEVPDEESSKEILEAKNNNPITIQYLIRALGEKNLLINAISTEISNIELELQKYGDNLSRAEIGEKEILHSKAMLLTKKINDIQLLKKLTLLEINYYSNKIGYENYKQERDVILSELVLNRAYIYRIKEWTKLTYQNHNKELDSDWYLAFNIFIYGNKRNKQDSDSNNLSEARDIIRSLEANLKKKNTILPEDENVKEAMSLLTVVPNYMTLLSQENKRSS